MFIVIVKMMCMINTVYLTMIIIIRYKGHTTKNTQL